MLGPHNETNAIFTEELYFMLLVTLALKTLVSISQNGLSPIAINKQIDNHCGKNCQNLIGILVALGRPERKTQLPVRFKD